MTDHVDGPRQIGDPSADLSDLFAFISPADAGRTVLAANVFPSAGVSAMFSNVIDHTMVVRRVTVAALGDAAKFTPGDQEYRFSCRFDVLERGPAGTKPIQRGTCTFPDGQTLRFVTNDERGAATPDGVFRVYAGLRSDPFCLAWLPATLTKVPNLLQHDNVLSIVIEFDTRRVLDPDKGSLFGVIAETTPVPRPRSPIGHEPPRLDWVGRPEQTNMRLNNPAMDGTDDVRDLWNQQTPFAISEELRPIFRKRMIDSLANWDMRDGKADWTPSALAASAEVFLDDFLLFDVAKPITDTSHLEIEKSTLNGRPYQTGGGRTVNADIIDILLTWIVNHDQGEALQGGATSATQPGRASFPYLAPANAQVQTVAETVDLSSPPGKIWEVVGSFDLIWHPLVLQVVLTGNGVDQLRTIEMIDGKQLVERLEEVDNARYFYRYTMVSGIQAVDYTGTFEVKPKGTGSSLEWRVNFLADGQPDFVIRTIVGTLLKTGLASLASRFGSPK